MHGAKRRSASTPSGCPPLAAAPSTTGTAPDGGGEVGPLHQAGVFPEPALSRRSPRSQQRRRCCRGLRHRARRFRFRACCRLGRCRWRRRRGRWRRSSHRLRHRRRRHRRHCRRRRQGHRRRRLLPLPPPPAGLATAAAGPAQRPGPAVAAATGADHRAAPSAYGRLPEVYAE